MVDLLSSYSVSYLLPKYISVNYKKEVCSSELDKWMLFAFLP